MSIVAATYKCRIWHKVETNIEPQPTSPWTDNNKCK